MGMFVYIKLCEVGIIDVILIEKVDCVGGIWWENIYSGIVCDILVFYYCYFFEFYVWMYYLVYGGELQNYMEYVGYKYGII